MISTRDPFDYKPTTFVRNWGNGDGLRWADLFCGTLVTGGTGCGKSSAVGFHIADGLLASGAGGLVLCAKPDEANTWRKYIVQHGRAKDLRMVDAKGQWRFNPLDWEANRNSEIGGGQAANVVNILDEVGRGMAKLSGTLQTGGGDAKFFEDGNHLQNLNLVELPTLAGVNVSMDLLSSILESAPTSFLEASDERWAQNSLCAAILKEADIVTAKASNDLRQDFERCRKYWLKTFPRLSDKTRSIFVMMFEMLAQPLLSRPLRKLFCTDTNIRPEDAFDGKIIVIDLPVQTFRLGGRLAALLWKFCFQTALLRRSAPADGNLRPAFLFADEAQNFITDFDAEYAAVARSAGGCTVYMTQNRESFRRVLGNDDAVDSLLANLQTKFFCQNTGETNEWAAKMFGERWVNVTSTNVGRSGDQHSRGSSGVTQSEQRRLFVEPSTFTTLKRGGELNNFLVEAILYKGGQLFPGSTASSPKLPFKKITFKQK